MLINQQTSKISLLVSVQILINQQTFNYIYKRKKNQK